MIENKRIFKWILLVVITLAAILLIVFVARGKPGTTGSAQLAFSAVMQGLPDEEIYVINGNGNDLKNLSNNPANDKWPVWSPDGKKIAFCSNREGDEGVYIMNADGSKQHRLWARKNSCTYPSTGGTIWSPNGKWLALTAPSNEEDSGSPTDIFLVRSDGSESINLTNDPGSDWAPSWSPDGKKVAFISNRDGNEEVYWVKVDGKGLVNISNNPASDLAVRWTPNGKSLLFLSNRMGLSQVFTVKTNGKDMQYITAPDLNVGQFAPIDGDQILFISSQDGLAQIFRIKSDGTEQSKAIESNDSESTFWVSSTGKRIAYNSYTGYIYESNVQWTSWMYDLEFGEKVSLPAFVYWACWRP